MGDKRGKDAPTSMRVKLKVSSVEAFIEKFTPNIHRSGMFLASKSPKDVGTTLRFELLTSDGRIKLLKGEALVAWVRNDGMGLRFRKLDAESRRLIDRIVSKKHAAGEPDGTGEVMAAAQEAQAEEPDSGPIKAPEASATPVPEPEPEPEPEPASDPTPPPAPAPPTSQDAQDEQDEITALLAEGMTIQEALERARAIARASLSNGGMVGLDDLEALLAPGEPLVISIDDASANLAVSVGGAAVMRKPLREEPPSRSEASTTIEEPEAIGRATTESDLSVPDDVAPATTDAIPEAVPEPSPEPIPEPIPQPNVEAVSGLVASAAEAESVPEPIPEPAALGEPAIPDEEWAERSSAPKAGLHGSYYAAEEDERADDGDFSSAGEAFDTEAKPEGTYQDPDPSLLPTVVPGQDEQAQADPEADPTREMNLRDMGAMMDVDILEEEDFAPSDLGAGNLEATELERLAINQPADPEESTTLAVPQRSGPPPVPETAKAADTADTDEPLDINELGIEVELEEDISAAERAQGAAPARPPAPPPPEEPPPRRTGFFKKLFGK